MVTQNLKTVVTLGGTVDGSFNKMGSAFNESMGKATKTVKELEREQGKLTKEIRKSKLAGADVSLLTRRYQQLGEELDDARLKAEAFEEASGLGDRLLGIGAAGAAAVGGIWATTTAITGLMTVTNDSTATLAGMAKSYDMSIERFQAWSGVAQQAGLNGEHIGDLIEELSNKFGEFKALGEQSSVADVFGALGIDEAMMEGMAAADQFEFIMARLQGVTDKQEAASLADMLFGGEGNKVTTYIRNTGKSLNALLDEQRQFNMLTEEGASGAVAYGQSFKNLRTVISSAWQEISGIVGGEMAGDIQQLGQTVSQYFRENKEDVVGTLKTMVYGARDFAVAVWNVGATVNRVVQIFGGWQMVGLAVASLLAGKLVMGLGSMIATGYQAVKAIGAMKVGMAGFNAVMAANPIGLTVAAVGALIFAGTQLYQNWDAVTGWFSEKLTWFKTEFPATFNVIKTLFDWSPLGLIVNHWAPITGFFNDLWGGIAGIFDASLARISGIWDTVSGWKDSLTFWESDSPAPPVKSYHQVQQEAAQSRTVAAINSSYPASKGHTVHQSVGEIKVYAAPGQSPADVAQAVHSQLGGYQDSALYDLPEAG
ncbi:phage tail tape measure protein [Photobacterium ganghwense]|uniref:phage tail tape measure protein n=1 Tax=Photobacterium ganghwense TaxID=320778 RepID=UPI001C2D1FD1|nr:phage tail tape measure protein [Photobacterium ganghwense]MBV1841391.1 phage tail tape measure protein [Photobacterium ganghwense]